MLSLTKRRFSIHLLARRCNRSARRCNRTNINFHSLSIDLQRRTRISHLAQLEKLMQPELHRLTPCSLHRQWTLLAVLSQRLSNLRNSSLSTTSMKMVHFTSSAPSVRNVSGRTLMLLVKFKPSHLLSVRAAWRTSSVAMS